MGRVDDITLSPVVVVEVKEGWPTLSLSAVLPPPSPSSKTLPISSLTPYSPCSRSQQLPLRPGQMSSGASCLSMGSRLALVKEPKLIHPWSASMCLPSTTPLLGILPSLNSPLGFVPPPPTPLVRTCPSLSPSRTQTGRLLLVSSLVSGYTFSVRRPPSRDGSKNLDLSGRMPS